MQLLSAAARIALLAGLVVSIGSVSRAVPNTTLEIYENNVLVDTLDQTELNCSDTGPGIAQCELGHFIRGNLEFGEPTNPGAPGLSITLNEDPEIATSFGLKNLGATQNFTLVFTMSVAPIVINTLTGGSNAWDFGDNNGDGVALSTLPGSSLYTALIDGAPHDTLFDHPSGGADPSAFGGGTVGPDSFGNPIPSQAGPPVTTSIGIRYHFELTGGDDASSSTGRFVVKPVPEPATAALIALGLLGLATAGRRR